MESTSLAIHGSLYIYILNDREFNSLSNRLSNNIQMSMLENKIEKNKNILLLSKRSCFEDSTGKVSEIPLSGLIFYQQTKIDG